MNMISSLEIRIDECNCQMDCIVAKEQLSGNKVKPVDEIHSFLAGYSRSVDGARESIDKGRIAIDGSQFLHAFQAVIAEGNVLLCVIARSKGEFQMLFPRLLRNSLDGLSCHLLLLLLALH